MATTEGRLDPKSGCSRRSTARFTRPRKKAAGRSACFPKTRFCDAPSSPGSCHRQGALRRRTAGQPGALPAMPRAMRRRPRRYCPAITASIDACRGIVPQAIGNAAAPARSTTTRQLAAPVGANGAACGGAVWHVFRQLGPCHTPMPGPSAPRGRAAPTAPPIAAGPAAWASGMPPSGKPAAQTSAGARMGNYGLWRPKMPAPRFL